MNTDRFLTRVFDKKEKRMLYPSDKAKHGIFLGINNDGIIFESDYVDYGDLKSSLVVEPFDTRYYIPMQCTGNKGTDNKLLYQEDIIVSDNRKALIVCDDLGNNNLIFQPFNNDDLGYFHSLSFDECVAIGNRWENEKLLKGNDDAR